MGQKIALLALALSIVPLLFVHAWLGIAAAIATYVLAARMAVRDMDRVFLIRSLKAKPKVPR